MKDQYYADNRDLVKWWVLTDLADAYKAQKIIQIAFARESEIRGKTLTIDGAKREGIPDVVWKHFRSLSNIKRMEGMNNRIEVFATPFTESRREEYLAEVKDFILNQPKPRIAFLDPDTGLKPKKSKGAKYVYDNELKEIWNVLWKGDLLVLYQHKFRDSNWIKIKREQFRKAVEVNPQSVKQAMAEKVAADVVFFFCEKK